MALILLAAIYAILGCFFDGQSGWVDLLCHMLPYALRKAQPEIYKTLVQNSCSVSIIIIIQNENRKRS